MLPGCRLAPGPACLEEMELSSGMGAHFPTLQSLMKD